jgi:hypothetical protein
MTTPVPDPVPVPPASKPHGVLAWLDEHIVPGLRDALADAEKVRAVIPEVEAFLPKLAELAKAEPSVAAALEPLIAEAEALLAEIAGL